MSERLATLEQPDAASATGDAGQVMRGDLPRAIADLRRMVTADDTDDTAMLRALAALATARDAVDGVTDRLGRRDRDRFGPVVARIATALDVEAEHVTDVRAAFADRADLAGQLVDHLTGVSQRVHAMATTVALPGATLRNLANDIDRWSSTLRGHVADLRRRGGV